MQKLKIVITGASGFIGGHLVSHLSNTTNTQIVPLTRREFPNLIRVSDYADAPDGDVLIHLAEDNNLQNVTDRGLTYENEVLSTLTTLLNKRYRKVIYTSSSTLYGDKSVELHGTTDKIYVNNQYSRIKSLSESAILKQPNGIVVRLANVYGPLMSTTNVISQILRQIPQQGDVIVGDSMPVRDFVWVRDVVDGISRLALRDFPEGRKAKLYNLGSGIGTSIGDVARLILGLAGQSERRVVSKNQKHIFSKVTLDYADTTEVCGWIPKVTLREGLEHLLKLDYRT
jgi:UDP-glucose 4-epimerase